MGNTTYDFSTVIRRLKEDDKYKKDIWVPANQIFMKEDLRVVNTKNKHKKGLLVTERAINQLLNRYGVPIRESKNLAKIDQRAFAYMINDLLSSDSSNILMRVKNTRRGVIVRAFLTEAYSILNNSKVAENIVNNIDSSLKPKIIQFHNEEKMLHMRIVFDSTDIGLDNSMIKKGDILKTGIDISNSEVGYKSLIIEPLVYRLVCSNGLRTWGTDGDIIRQRHSFISDRELNQLVITGVNDSEEKALELIRKLDNSRKLEIGNPVEFIRRVGEEQRIGKKFTEKVVNSYLEEPLRNRYGVVNAFTRASRHLDIEPRTKIETLAGRVLIDDNILKIA